MTKRTLLLAGTAGLASLFAAMPALAAGTAASTMILNSVDVQYEAAGSTVTLPALANDQITVDEIIDFEVTVLNPPEGLVVDPAQEDATLAFSLKNTGNAERSFDIDLAVLDEMDLVHDTSGDEGSYAVYVSTSQGDLGALYDPSGLQPTPGLAPDATLYISIVAQIPADAVDDAESLFSLTVSPLDAGGSAMQAESTTFAVDEADVVYGDPSMDGVEAASDFYEVQAAMVSATKTLSIASENRDGSFDCMDDPDEGGVAFMPGACLNYTITITNHPDASEDAVDFSVTDYLPGNLQYEAIYSHSGFDLRLIETGKVTGTVDRMAPGESATMTIRATIK